MNKVQRLEKIIEDHLPAINWGQETIESVLAKYPKEAGELQPRLEAALWLANAKKSLEPRPRFIPSSRKYLEERLASVSPRTFWRRFISRYTPQRWAFNLVAPIVLLLVIALVINSLILTARLSIPGDPLYSTKLVIENVQLAFTFNVIDKTDLSIQFSRERTMEFVQLVLEGDYAELPAAATRLESGIIASLHSLNDVSMQDRESGSLMISSLHNTLSNEIGLLKVLRETSPVSSHPGIDLAIQVAQAGVMTLP